MIQISSITSISKSAFLCPNDSHDNPIGYAMLYCIQSFFQNVKGCTMFFCRKYEYAIIIVNCKRAIQSRSLPRSTWFIFIVSEKYAKDKISQAPKEKNSNVASPVDIAPNPDTTIPVLRDVSLDSCEVIRKLPSYLMRWINMRKIQRSSVAYSTILTLPIFRLSPTTSCLISPMSWIKCFR